MASDAIRCECLCLWKQKISRRETYMHKVQPNPANHLQHAGGQSGGSWGFLTSLSDTITRLTICLEQASS
jgi:hypothetical protein